MPTRERLRRFICESFFVDDFGDDDSFLASGLIDSLGVMQIVAFVEAEFSLRVPDADLLPDNFDSLSKLTAYVERALTRERAA
jgi:acyl carrier protein